MQKLMKFIREITVAPLIAFYLLTALALHSFDELGRWQGYLVSCLWLTFLPLSAYPLQRFLPKYRDKGREGQRNLAIVMAILGYILSIAYAAIFRAPRLVWAVYLSYLFSGVILLFVNKVLRVKASGHACGISGPFTLATVYFGWIAAAIGVATLILVYFASIKMGRHTTSQYITGSLISVPMVLLSAWIAGIF